jgi:hypothetical protein
VKTKQTALAIHLGLHHHFQQRLYQQVDDMTVHNHNHHHNHHHYVFTHILMQLRRVQPA